MESTILAVFAAIMVSIPTLFLCFAASDISSIAKALKKQNEMYRLVHASYLRGMEVEKE